ncbi:hypothetical protein F5972_08310 [Microbispora cellulosiformans]|uniref:Uncharacterized protein n=1 Tax=Microbispora cellulosiformans TaxID=2614688 RepID=A0A5J5K559_9ACTN|nr:hypothetical protein [Microbispora cellulosiformans]KAA9379646.1 hypothetical protein F5972_08310 [Microbispora cellulosiformans]
MTDHPMDDDLVAGPPEGSAPLWFHDGELSLLRRQMQAAQADLAQAEGDAPPGFGVPPALREARLRAATLEERFARCLIGLVAAPRGAEGDLVARVLAAVADQEQRLELETLARLAGDDSGAAAAALLRTAAVRLGAVDVARTPDVAEVVHDLAEGLTALVPVVRDLFGRVDADDADLGETVDALESAAGGVRVLDLHAQREGL